MKSTEMHLILVTSNAQLRVKERTLSTVVIDIRIKRVVLDSFIETLESLRRVALLHVHTSNLDPALCERGNKPQGFVEIVLCAINVTSEESR
jgi:hypothetical protein